MQIDLKPGAVSVQNLSTSDPGICFRLTAGKSKFFVDQHRFGAEYECFADRSQIDRNDDLTREFESLRTKDPCA
jgi:hypothetical protein